jgi:tetratricopeptide (TPR) repeat protein
MSWSTLFKFVGPNAAFLSAILALLIAVGIAVRQWVEKPIAIGPFTVVNDADKHGVAAIALADQLKAQISQINADSGDLFESRKLVDNAIPLDIKLGNTGWTFATLTKAFKVQFTSVEVSGRMSEVGKYLVLEFTASQGNRIYQYVYPIPLPTPPLGQKDIGNTHPSEDPDETFRNRINAAIACVAFNVVMKVSPDVAANYLHKHESMDIKSPAEKTSCSHPDDVDLYSEVTKDRFASPAARVNALVGLSVHYSETHQYYEEVTMAKSATELASATMPCDDRWLLSWWQNIQCVILFQTRTNNRRAQIAAWMQYGAALSDYANVAATFGETQERRQNAIIAYQRVVVIDPRYALGFDALGLQLSLWGDQEGANLAYKKSLDLDKTSPAHLDLGLALIRGRNEVYTKLPLSPDALNDAKEHFAKAIGLSPDYWDAHSRLGYVLYYQQQYREAADALEVVFMRDTSNRYLRRFLASVYSDLCSVDEARSHFIAAYQEAVKQDSDEAKQHREKQELGGRADDNSLNTLSDWGKALDGFGFHEAALEQENAVLEVNPKHVDALVFRGLMQIKDAHKDPDRMTAGLADLKAAVDYDSRKSDFVLEAYLLSLIEMNRAADAVVHYEEWAKEGVVPPPISNPGIDVRSLSPNPRLRIIYAKALELNHQLREAETEHAILLRMGVPSDAITDPLHPTAGGAVADEDDRSPPRTCKMAMKYQSPRLKDVSITAMGMKQ